MMTTDADAALNLYRQARAAEQEADSFVQHAKELTRRGYGPAAKNATRRANECRKQAAEFRACVETLDPDA